MPSDRTSNVRTRRLPFAIGLLIALSVAVLLVSVGGWTIDRAAVGHAQADGPWERIDENLYGDNVSDLAFVGDPSRNFRFFLMVSEGFGLFRGQSTLTGWSMVAPNPALPDAPVAQSVAVARDDIERQTAYVGLQSRPSLAISDDSGQTWRTEPGPGGISRVDLLDTTIGGRIWAGQVGSPDLHYSDDRGISWEVDPRPTGSLNGIDRLFAAPDRSRIWLQSGERLWSSGDQPGGWQAMLGPESADPVTLTLRVQMAAAGPNGRVWAAGLRAGLPAIQFSDDAGATWQPAAWPGGDAGDISALTAAEAGFGQPGVWLAFDDGLEGGRVFESTDDGQSWTEVFEAPIAPRGIHVDPHDYTVYVGTDGMGLYRLTDPVLHTGAIPADMLAVTVPEWNGKKRVLALGRVTPTRRDTPGAQPAWKILFRSDDAGESWARRYVTTGLGTSLHPSRAFASDRRVYSGRFLSADAGRTWRSLADGPSGEPPHVVAVGPITATRPALFGLEVPYVRGIGGGTGLVHSQDGGGSWMATDVTVGGISAVAFSPAFADDGTAFFTTDRGKVFRTGNGTDFEEIGRLPIIAGQGSVPMLAVSPAFTRDRTLVALVENRASPQPVQIHVSNDGGVTWNQRTDGLEPGGRPSAMILSPGFELDRILFLGTLREMDEAELPAIYASDSAGLEWFGELRMRPDAVHAFGWGGSSSDGKVFAAAGRAGLWSRVLDGGPIEPILPTATATRTPGPETATPTPTATREVTAEPTATPQGDLETACANVVADAHARSSQSGSSAGMDSELLVWEDETETAHTYLNFEPPPLPDGATVVSGTISLWLRVQQNEGAAPVTLMRAVSEPWTESRLSWSSRPRLGNDLSTRVVGNRPGWKEWDASDAIGGWYTDPSRNDGVAILPQAAPGDSLRIKFASRENPVDPSPKLCVHYRAPAATPVATPTPSATGGSPTASPSPSASPTVGSGPSATPVPTETVTATPQVTATDTPSAEATGSPTASATASAPVDAYRIFAPFAAKRR